MGANRNAVPMEGRVFGWLTVLRRSPAPNKKRRLIWWLCRCTCGVELAVRGDKLRQGHRTTCGNRSHKAITVRRVASSEFSIWNEMLQRCKPEGHKNYGRRGIRVCKRWHHFENFLSDMGPRPSVQHSIDRYPNNDGHYEPGNCRWATDLEQAANTRRTIYVIFKGKRRTLLDVTAELRLRHSMIVKRLRRGWHLEEAIGMPAGSRRVDSEFMKLWRLHTEGS